MASTVAVQTNSFGLSFQAVRNSLMAMIRSSTLRNESRRMRLLVNSANQRSIRFSQLQLVGTVDDKARMLAEPGFHIGMPVGAVVIHDQMQALLA